MADGKERGQPTAVAGEVFDGESDPPTRRRLLLALSAGGVAALGMQPAEAVADCLANQESDGTLDSQPFYGPRQAGVVTPQPAAALFELTQSVGAPTALRDIGMPNDGIGRAVEAAMATPYWNPRALQPQILHRLLNCAWEGVCPSRAHYEN